MSTNVTNLPPHASAKDITTKLASGALTISKALVYRLGSEVTVELQYSDSTKGYIKMKQGRIKVGGSDNTFSTGTELTWLG